MQGIITSEAVKMKRPLSLAKIISHNLETVQYFTDFTDASSVEDTQLA